MSRSGSTTRDRTARRAERRTERRGPAPVTPLRRRRPERPRSRRRLPIQLAGALSAVAVVAWLLLAGPVLAVRAVQVDGVSTLPADQVTEAAGIDSGTPLLRLDVRAAEQRVARLPPVASVKVTRDWPDSVVITVVERVPVVIVGQPGRRSLVDADGVLFDTVTGAPPAGVVPLEVADPGPDDPATMAGLAAVSALPPAVRRQVAGATVISAEDISLTLTDGTVVRWGDAERSAAKAAALAAVLEQIGAKGLKPAGTIDVSTPAAVVLR